MKIKQIFVQLDNSLVWMSSQDRYYLASGIFTLISVIIILSLYLFSVNVLPTRLPLFYSLPWGQSELTNKSSLLILPTIITIVALINMLLAWQLHSSQYVLKRILLMSTVLIDLIILIAAIKIVFIFA